MAAGLKVGDMVRFKFWSDNPSADDLDGVMVNNEDVSDHDMGRDFIVYKCINYIKLIWIYLIIQIYVYMIKL